MMEGSVSLFPISFFELGLAGSLTSRYLPSRLVDCELYLCKGNLMREKDSQIFGLGLLTSRNFQSDGKNESQYFLFREKRPDFAMAIGIGRFASTISAPGLSLFGNITWSWGSSRALF
jgi:hypothetical protein